jgi:hypothetical protein
LSGAFERTAIQLTWIGFDCAKTRDRAECADISATVVNIDVKNPNAPLARMIAVDERAGPLSLA